MRLLGLDFETTGLDTKNDRITEIGLCLWEVETKRPLTTVGVFLHDASYPKLSDEITKLTGITDEMLQEFGTEPKGNLQWLDSYCSRHRVDYVVAHNGRDFDMPFLEAEFDRHGVAGDCIRHLPLIDTKTDIPFASEPDSRRLKHLALDCGFINPFAHRAVFDVLTMLRVLSNYSIEDVVNYAKIPWMVVRAVVPHPKYDGGAGKDLAKKIGFRWQDIGGKNYPGWWVKKIKEDQLDAESRKLPGYQIVRVTE
jgi:DNA polymerase-3 subunit epsilon